MHCICITLLSSLNNLSPAILKSGSTLNRHFPRGFRFSLSKWLVFLRRQYPFSTFLVLVTWQVEPLELERACAERFKSRPGSVWALARLKQWGKSGRKGNTGEAGKKQKIYSLKNKRQRLLHCPAVRLLFDYFMYVIIPFIGLCHPLYFYIIGL